MSLKSRLSNFVMSGTRVYRKNQCAVSGFVCLFWVLSHPPGYRSRILKTDLIWSLSKPNNRPNLMYSKIPVKSVPPTIDSPSIDEEKVLTKQTQPIRINNIRNTYSYNNQHNSWYNNITSWCVCSICSVEQCQISSVSSVREWWHKDHRNATWPLR